MLVLQETLALEAQAGPRLGEARGGWFGAALDPGASEGEGVIGRLTHFLRVVLILNILRSFFIFHSYLCALYYLRNW